MKLLAIALVSLFTVTSATWFTDFTEAKKAALEKHQYILLNFSGSDWCGPCIRLHKEIFDSEAFTSFANEQLVLVNADFPRLKKNQLTKAQEQQNEKLADTYNSAGHFPYTVLLNADGKIIKAWDGFPKESAEAFTNEVKQAIDAGN